MDTPKDVLGPAILHFAGICRVFPEDPYDCVHELRTDMQTYGTTAQFDAPCEMTGQSCFAGPDLLIHAQVKTTGVYCWWLPSQPPFLFSIQAPKWRY